MRRWSRGSRTSPTPGVAQGGIQGGSLRGQGRSVAGSLGRAGRAVPLHRPRRRRGHRALVGGHQHRAGSGRSASRAASRPGPCGSGIHIIVPDRLLQPDRGPDPLGLDLPDPRPRDPADHRVRRSCRRSRSRRAGTAGDGPAMEPTSSDRVSRGPMTWRSPSPARSRSKASSRSSSPIRPVDEALDGQPAGQVERRVAAGSRRPGRRSRSSSRGSAGRRRRTGRRSNDARTSTGVIPTRTAVPPRGRASIASSTVGTRPIASKHEVRARRR